jgi:protein gp37
MYDPTLRKYRDIVKALLKQDRPENRDDALELVDEVIAAKSNRKRVKRNVSASELRDQFVMRIATFIMRQPVRAWTVTLKEVFEQVKAVVITEQEERRAAVESQQRATDSRANTNGSNGAAPVIVHSITDPKSPTVTMPPSLAGRKSSRPQTGAKYAHPWGDAYLDVLEVLKPDCDGNERVRFHRKSLYEVGMNLKPTRYLVAGKLDLFDTGVADEVFDEHLNVFLKAGWHTFVALTSHPESIQRHWQRWKVKPRRGFPVNFWPGVRVDCVDHLRRIGTLREISMRTHWASFLDFHSEASHPLSKSTFRSVIRGIGLVVFGWDFTNPQSPLSSIDALALANAATESESRFFFTHPKSRQAFLTETPPVSELPAAKNPPVNDEGTRKLFENAQESQNLPREWFKHPFSGRKGAFQKFSGEEIQVFDYKSDSGLIPSARQKLLA